MRRVFREYERAWSRKIEMVVLEGCGSMSTHFFFSTVDFEVGLW
jgi:hypothetical protein